MDASPAPSPARAAPQPGQPYCGVCGYALAGATETAKCPECGTPIVECLVRGPHRFGNMRSKRYTSPVHILGMPLVQIAFGPDPVTGAMRGRAKAFIALGDQATGVFAFGGVATGVVAFGGVAFGAFTGGGVSAGLLTAMGGLSMGAGLSAGGVTVGALSIGGVSVGYGAVGGLAVGRFAYGGLAVGSHAITGGAPISSDPQAASFFRNTSWYFGVAPVAPGRSLIAGWQAAACILGIDVLATGAIMLVALWAKRRSGRADPFATRA